jgi:isocitrate lyase
MAGKVLVPISEHINRLVAIRLQYDIMGVENLVIARTDSEAATLITSNVDARDHAFILGSTNPALRPLAAVMDEAEASGAAGDALQAVEDAWTAAAKLQSWAETLADALRTQTRADARAVDRFLARVEHASRPEALAAARELGLHVEPFWDWDAPRTREGYYRYQGGTRCAVRRAAAFAPYADLLWMETKKPILAQAVEFAEGVHKVHPGHWLAYNLSPSFNWDAAGLGTEDMKRYVWELGKLGFVWQFITVSLLIRGSGRDANCATPAWRAAFERVHFRPVRPRVCERGHEGVRGTDPAQGTGHRLRRAHAPEMVSRYRHVIPVSRPPCSKRVYRSGADYADNLLKTVTGGVSSTAAMGKGVTESQFGAEKSKL